ncbi:hypothetical protein GAY33_05190 [Azospirillum brasilense]|uniref:hypothetical protein n=1 Tax=Azospirillum argentinense TaxID=2970906 RepID=UPI00190C6E74|nr:hypothetical protein [Azospirillum argentinense]MBK3798631.1 hypothetical protein [Azospirillum argentinense]
MTETTGKLGVSAFVAALLERDGLRTTKGTVSKHAAAGKIPCERDAKGHPVFDYEVARDAFLALDPAKRLGPLVRDTERGVGGLGTGTDEAPGEAGPARPRSLAAAASQDYVDTKADQAKLNYAKDLLAFAQDVGQLVTAGAVDAGCTDAVQALREALRSSRDDLSNRLATLTDPAAIRRALAERDDAALTAFCNALDALLPATAAAAAA